MESLGSYLKLEREKKGIRLEEISSITRIGLFNLQLIEAGRWSDLPPEPFIRGFIVAYSKFIGLDPTEVIDLYLQEIAPEVPENELLTNPPSNDPAPSSRVELPKTDLFSFKKNLNASPSIKLKWSIAGIALILLGSIILYKVAKPSNRQSPSVAKSEILNSSSDRETVGKMVGRHISEAPTPPIEKLPAAEEKKVLNSTASTHEITVAVKNRTWAKVVVDDTAPVESFINPDEKIKYSANSKIKLVLGNSSGSQVHHNGDLVSGVKFQGTIRSYIYPADARFPQDPPIKRAEASTAEKKANDNKETVDSEIDINSNSSSDSKEEKQ